MLFAAAGAEDKTGAGASGNNKDETKETTKTKNKKCVVEKSLWGKFNLPYNIGQTVELESKLYDELLKSGHVITPAAAKAKAEAVAKEEKENE